MINNIYSMNEQWSKEKAKFFMMTKQANLLNQNIANASIWYNTLFSKGLNPGDENYNFDQERVLLEQQAMLKKHFLAMAVLGVQGGEQFNKIKKKENYQPIENFKQEGVSANLATLASIGGRFNYRSKDGSANEFNTFLMGTDDLDTLRSYENTFGGNLPTTYMGAYKRIGTHSESFDGGEIIELDRALGGVDATGIDIPIGGIGQSLFDIKGRPVVTGYQGVSFADRRSNTLGDKQKKYQTGHVFHRFASSKDGLRAQILISFEASAPNMDNIFGGSHKVFATINKKIFGGISKRTLTGQDKRHKLGMPNKIGGIKADITKQKVEILKKIYSLLDSFKKSSNINFNQLEKKYYQRILISETVYERNNIFNELLEKKLVEHS
ncbi:hypothetical protein [Tenacibaculum sp. C7A-26P2]|uniref:hypothetical protein n=1 Tax=Tenacibaculum sp. C7A-26P2 TaxID=3447504 RepID=UPI003F838BBC